MSNDTLNRREFFKRAAILGAAITGAGSFLAACERGDGGQSQQGAQAQNGGSAGGDLDCTDTSGLESTQVKIRESLKYTDDSPEAGKTCDNCQLYKPASAGSCGGCQTVPGPIHPKGWCSAWVAQA